MVRICAVLLLVACTPAPYVSPVRPPPESAPVPSTDPYERASQEKLAHSPGCSIPFGQPALAQVVADDGLSALTVCAHDRGGFVLVTGRGGHAAHSSAEAAIPPPAGCPAPVPDDPERSAFWKQIRQGLRDGLIVQNGFGLHLDCDGAIAHPERLAIRVVDWADLGATIAIVRAAMRDHDICGVVAIEVAGVACATLD